VQEGMQEDIPVFIIPKELEPFKTSTHDMV
jgi:hypothetical protein